MFNIFISDMGTGNEFTLSKLADDTTLVGALGTLEEREVIQRDQDRLEMGACVKLMKFTRPSSAPGPGQSQAQREAGCQMISPAKKYLVVFMDDRLDMTQKCALASQKARRVLG